MIIHKKEVSVDLVKNNLFINDLNYQINTIQYLFDYHRIIETVPIVDRVLNKIESFRKSNLENGLNGFFLEDFWRKRLPAGMTFNEMRTIIKDYSRPQSSFDKEDLDNIKYILFVRNLFNWADENISKLRYEAKSPLLKKIEKNKFYLIGITIGLSLSIIAGWMFFTQGWGLKGDFYSGENFEKYLYSGYKKTIDFSYPKQMDSRLPFDYFSVRWKGTLLVPKNGEYTIFTSEDDGDRLFIDNQLIIDDWYPHFEKESSKKMFLSKGPHSITLEYFQRDIFAVLKLSWAIDGGNKEIIPAKYLRH